MYAFVENNDSILIIVRLPSMGNSGFNRMFYYSRTKANDPAAGFEVAFSRGLPDDII